MSRMPKFLLFAVLILFLFFRGGAASTATILWSQSLYRSPRTWTTFTVTPLGIIVADEGCGPFCYFFILLDINTGRKIWQFHSVTIAQGIGLPVMTLIHGDDTRFYVGNVTSVQAFSLNEGALLFTMQSCKGYAL